MASQIPIHIGYGYPYNQTYGYRPYGNRPYGYGYRPHGYEYRDAVRDHNYNRRITVKPSQKLQFGGIHFPTLLATLAVAAFLLR